MLKKMYLIWAVLLSLVPARAFAHGSESAAPDLHPLLVGAEFIVLILAGVWLARRLSRMGAGKP